MASVREKLLRKDIWKKAMEKCEKNEWQNQTSDPQRCGNVTQIVDCYPFFFENAKFQEMNKKCKNECGPPQKSLSYSLSMTSLDGELREEIGCHPNLSNFWLRDSRLKLTITKEVPKMSFVDLFGLVGGYLGLFVGVSLTTIIEFLEFVLVALLKWVCQTEGRRVGGLD